MDTATARKAMEATISLLGQISVPMALMEQIAIPIQHAINNMHIGLEAIREEPEKQEEPAEVEDGNDHAG